MTTTPDAAAHRATNARLCEWLGVEPKREWFVKWNDAFYGRPFVGGGFKSQEKAQEFLEHGVSEQRREEDGIPRWLSARVEEYVEYPDLATREGFWVLWDALIAKGYTPCMLQDRGLCDATIAVLETRMQVDTVAEKPWSVLVATAVALMEREANRGN